MNCNLVGKRLLVQGAGRGNLGLVKTAKSQGVFTIITGMGGDYPCTPLADVNCYADITDEDAVLKVAQEHNIDGAIICCSDTGLNAIGRCNDVMHLSGISEESAIVASNKSLMKEALIKGNVRTAQFYKIYNKEELLEAVNKLGYPVIIKATDLQGSRGISIVKDEICLIDAFSDVISLTRKDYCIVEEFIEGVEFGAQAFVYNNEILFVLPHGDETMMCKTAVPVGHYMPYEMSKELYNDTYLQVKNAIKALNLNNCAVNVDLIIKENKVYIIELTGRVGANCLPELTSNYLGVNYYDMILNVALGENPLPIFENRKAPCATLARMIRSNISGIVKTINVPQMDNVDIHMFVKEADEVRTFTNCNDAIGEVIVKGNTLEDCEVIMDKVLSEIQIELN